ncbi:hypothetical protein ADIS_1269 [Lunatimonas lonarensis]|uniref:Uncharacterized protein n=1 Tax=Lunatimonas lonarensis TaxID=1232681 RepID=R7ZVF7_9BACT|nr:hypothetical protein ADIS_1269 [Lunatimonas lonarensis]
MDEEVDEEFIEIYVPTTGNISGMDRVFYYYAKTDTLDVILIQ